MCGMKRQILQGSATNAHHFGRDAMRWKPDASRPVGIDIGSYWSTKVSAEGGWAGIFDSLYL